MAACSSAGGFYYILSMINDDLSRFFLSVAKMPVDKLVEIEK